MTIIEQNKNVLIAKKWTFPNNHYEYESGARIWHFQLQADWIIALLSLHPRSIFHWLEGFRANTLKGANICAWFSFVRYLQQSEKVKSIQPQQELPVKTAVNSSAFFINISFVSSQFLDISQMFKVETRSFEQKHRL